MLKHNVAFIEWKNFISQINLNAIKASGSFIQILKCIVHLINLSCQININRS